MSAGALTELPAKAGAKVEGIGISDVFRDALNGQGGVFEEFERPFQPAILKVTHGG